MYENLLKEGEVIEGLDLGGWIVLRNLLSVGDEVIIDYHSYLPPLFTEPVRAAIIGISSNNLIKINLQTEGVKDRKGNVWPTGDYPYWLDCKFQCKKIVQVGIGSLFRAESDGKTLLEYRGQEPSSDQNHTKSC